MIRLVLFLALIAAAAPAAGQGLNTGGADGEAKRLWFEVNLRPETTLAHGAYIGGQMVLDIKLVSSDPFKRLRLQMPKIDGARVETLVRPHTLQINIFGGKGYSHQARYALFPRTDGTLVLPPIKVNGILQARSGRTFEFTETYPEQRIIVHPPDPSFAPDGWVVSQYVRLEEKWSSDVNRLHSGDTVRRTIVLTVDGARAEDLPPMDLPANPGYRVLHTEATAETRKGADGFTAHVEQSWDIFIASDDVFHIDPVRFAFWDPGDASAKFIEAPARRVEPLRRDAAALKAEIRQQVFDDLLIKKIGVLALLGVPALTLLIVVMLAALSALPNRADLRLWRAARRGPSSLEFYRDFQSWARRSLEDRPIVGEEQVAQLGPAAKDEVRGLHHAVFGRGGAKLDPRRMSRRLIRASIARRLSRLWAVLQSRLARLIFAQ